MNKNKTALTERQSFAVKSLKSEVKNEGLVIGRTDKSAKFYVTTEDLFEKEAEKHLQNAKQINLEDAEKIAPRWGTVLRPGN